MTGENVQSSEETLRRLRWQCRRGLLELDVWLDRFATAQLPRLNPAQRAQFEQLLQEPDADLLAWLQGRTAVPMNHAELIDRIRATV